MRRAMKALLLATILNLVQGLSPNCTCAEFCDGTCADTNRGTVTTVPLYRLTPLNVTDIRDKDTGDPAGDLGFFLVRGRAIASCKMPEQANEDGCFLAYEPVIRRFYVELDQKWGPYLRCNPLPFYHGADGPTDDAHVDTRHFGCFPWHGRGPTPWVPPTDSGRSSCQDGDYCFDLINRSVGRDLSMHRPFSPSHPEIAEYFGGYWYSTPSQAECTGDRQPGDGKLPYCSWRLANNSVKTVNATCMESHLIPKVLKNGENCFNTLPHDCRDMDCEAYYKCFLVAVMGCGSGYARDCPYVNKNTTITALPPQVLVDVWNLAFDKEDEIEGGCPSLPSIHN